MKRSSQDGGGQSQELRPLAGMSAAGGSSGPGSVTFESETGARRPRPRARSRDTPAPAADQPRRERHGAAKGGVDRPCQHHSFLTEPTNVKRMEADLLRLMEDFSSGNLRAFGKDVSVGQMEQIREQQERLARLHFEMGAQQELFPPLSEEGLSRASASLQELMAQLQQLSSSIEKLHTLPEPVEPPGGS